jgi:hypothetical protein
MRLAPNMLSTYVVAKPPPRVGWYADPEQKPNMPPVKDSPHDVVIALEDLKRYAIWLSCGAVAAAIIIGANYQSRLVTLEKHDNSQDMTIQHLEQQAEYAKEQLARLQSFIDSSQRNQSDILVQLSSLRANAASTEEITRATQARVEVLADYLRKNSKMSTPPAGVDSYDSLNQYKK